MIKQEWLDDALNELDLMTEELFLSKLLSGNGVEQSICIEKSITFSVRKPNKYNSIKFEPISEIFAEAA